MTYLFIHKNYPACVVYVLDTCCNLRHSTQKSQLIIVHLVKTPGKGMEQWAVCLMLATLISRSIVPPPDAPNRCLYIDKLGCISMQITGCGYVHVNLE